MTINTYSLISKKHIFLQAIKTPLFGSFCFIDNLQKRKKKQLQIFFANL